MRRFRVDPRAIATAACATALIVATSATALESEVDRQSSAAERTAQELERVRAEPLTLHDFLKRMPKGAELHNHLDGAVYAEIFIRVGAEDEFCIDTVAEAFTKSQPISRPDQSSSRYAKPATFPRRTPEKPSSACETFLKGSEKAEQQWELERRFGAFEAGF